MTVSFAYADESALIIFQENKGDYSCHTGNSAGIRVLQDIPN